MSRKEKGGRSVVPSPPFSNSCNASSETTGIDPFYQHDLTGQPAILPGCKRLKQHLGDNEFEIVKVKIE